MAITNRLSGFFQPRIIAARNSEVLAEGFSCKSQKLLQNLGVVRNTNVGTSFLLPLGMRSLHKLKKLVRKEMKTIGASEMSLPYLSSLQLWEKTDRSHLSELYKLVDRYDKEYVLSPTAEESITHFIATEPALASNHFPLRLYQISNKFRDEKKARFGLIRSKEFTMKDLYCFDVNQESAEHGYTEIVNSYNTFFKKLGVDYVQVDGSVGSIGGKYSHEFHFPSDIGDDKLILCKECGHSVNKSLCKKQYTCNKCGERNVRETSGIEVGHTFLLGTKYSEALGAKFINTEQKPEYLYMSCFGIGLSRIIGASVEVLSTNYEARWPLPLVPFSFVLIGPKSGSKEESVNTTLETLYKELDNSWKDDVVIDDRSHLTIGKRLHEAQQFGYPFVLVIGREAMKTPPLIELYDIYKNVTGIFEIPTLFNYLNEKFKDNNSSDPVILENVN